MATRTEHEESDAERWLAQGTSLERILHEDRSWAFDTALRVVTEHPELGVKDVEGYTLRLLRYLETGRFEPDADS